MDPTSPTGGGASGAGCALHPERSAVSICARCGNFMCAVCTDNGTYETCPTCRAITGEIPGFTWTRDTFTLDGLMGYAWENFKREWVMLSLAVLVYAVALFGVSFAGNLLSLIGRGVGGSVGEGTGSIVSSVLQSMAQYVLTGGFAVLVYRVMKGEAADVGKVFSEFSRLGTYIVAALLYFGVVLVPIIIGGIICGVVYGVAGETPAIVTGLVIFAAIIVPLIWALLPFTFVPMEIALGGEINATQAVKNAFAFSKDKRLWMLAFGLVGGFITLGGALLCCIGALPAVALVQLLNTSLYLALRNGSGLPPMRGENIR